MGHFLFLWNIELINTMFLSVGFISGLPGKNNVLITTSGRDFFFSYGKPLLPATMANAALSNTDLSVAFS